jgi:hypothetical protein
VCFAVPGHQVATGVEDQCGVVQRSVLSAFGDAAGHEPEVGADGRRGEARASGAISGLGRRAGVFGQSVGVVATRPELREYEELDAALGRQADHVQRDLEVSLGLTRHGQPLSNPNLEITFHIDTWFAVLPLIACFHRRTGPFVGGFRYMNALLQGRAIIELPDPPA